MLDVKSPVKSDKIAFLEPVYRADNVANQLLCAIGYNNPKAALRDRALVVAGSFLFTAHEILVTKNKNVLAFPTGKPRWANYPAVGWKIAMDVRQALEDAGYINLIPDTGKTIFDHEKNPIAKIATLYDLDTSLLGGLGLETTVFVEAHRPPVEVAEYENQGAKRARRNADQYSPKMSKHEARNQFGAAFINAQKRIEAINEYCRQHPLRISDSLSCGSVTRKFTNGSITSGGRLYGSYSQKEEPDRLGFTIDGSPVVEIDVRACQPTLLCCLYNHPIGGNWDDLYALLPYVKNEEQDEHARRRKHVKGVITELLGVGNHNKVGPSTELQDKGVDEFKFLEIRQQAWTIIPPLTKLKQDNRTSDNFLTYHESEIIISTIEQLIQADMPAYSMHDALLVRQSDQDAAVSALNKSWSDHCRAFVGATAPKEVHPALEISYSDGINRSISGQWVS